MNKDNIVSQLLYLYPYTFHKSAHHISALLKHSKILQSATNVIEPVYTKRKTFCSLHAEINVLTQYYRKNCNIKNNCLRYIDRDGTKIKSNLDLIVIRVNNENSFLNSEPCFHCSNVIKYFHIKNIYFSNGNGDEIVKKKTDCLNYHISRGNRNNKIKN